MAQPNHIQKTLVMKPEVTKIFDDLDQWLDYCRINLIEFNPRDLYKSKEYKEWQKEREGKFKKSRNDKKGRNGKSISN